MAKRKRKPAQARQAGAPVSSATNPMPSLALFSLRVGLMRECAQLGQYAFQALQGLEILGFRVRDIVARAPNMPEVEVRHELAEIGKARAIMEAAMRLGGVIGAAERPHSAATPAPGSDRRQ
jgi:hypothetical protein